MEIDAIKKKVLEDVDPETRRKKKKEMRIQRLIVTLQFLGIAAVVILIFYILMGISTVDGNSMYPTLHDKDIVIYNRRCKEYKAGDIVAIARACEEAGADGICLINTLLGMRIDVARRRPVIANTMGVFSGAAVFPVAVRMVYQVAKACRIPVMGCGGVTTARDVIEMMMAGATAVEVGAANLKNPYICKEIIEALPSEMERLGIERLADIVGCAAR